MSLKEKFPISKVHKAELIKTVRIRNIQSIQRNIQSIVSRDFETFTTLVVFVFF